MSLLRDALESATVERLGWTLLHFVWEGAAVALLLAGVLALLRRRGARARYAAACGALVVLAALPVASFVMMPVAERRAAAVAVPIPLAPARIDVPAGRPQQTPRNGIPTKARGDASLVQFNGVQSPMVAAKADTIPRADGAKPQAFTVTASAKLAEWGRWTVDQAAPVLPWAVLGWGVGVLMLSTWNLGGWAAMRRLRSLSTSAVSDEVARSAARLSGRLGLRRAVRIVQSTIVESPMVIGAIKPVILLPASLLTGLSPAQLDTLLAHQLAHVRRHDYLVNLVQGVIETVLFYHPAVWWVSRRIRVEREHCCDDAVVALTDNRAAYVRALAAVAEVAARRAPALGGAAARLAPAATGGTLLARVRRLLGMPDADAARSPRWLAGAVAMALCFLVATAVVTRGQDKPAAAADKPAQKDKDFDVPADKVLELEVVDKASGDPMPALTLSVRLDNQTRAFSTDGQGRARIEYPPAAKYVGVTAKPDGYVPTTASWRSYNAKDPVPDKFTLELERGTTIGGIVQDEAGKPVAGASVFLLLRSKGENPNGGRVTTAFSTDKPVLTDEEGRWRVDTAPKELDDPWIRLAHPDYLSDEMFGMTPKPPLAKLREQTGVMVLKKGVALAGRVLDDKGNPINGAKVAQGKDRFGSSFPEARTDAQGNFRFNQVRRGTDVVLTVTAKGRAPDQKTFRIERDTADVEFRLEPGRIVKGRVVDPDGKPVSGVMIATDTWRGNRALMFRTNTDAQGRWTWNEAPSDEVLTDILKQGFMDTRNVPIRPSDQEQTFTLRKPLHVVGTVVDEETGKPVDRFRVLPGIDWGQGQAVYWERQERVPGPESRGGKFEVDITFPRPGHAMRVESDGYLPAESRVFRDADGPVVALEFKLRKGQPLTGVVRGPDGQPVAGADVVLCMGQNGAYIRNGEIQQRRDNAAVQTDAAGRYKFPPQTGTYLLVVLHDRGYAEVTGEQTAKSPDITLSPWGRVAGVVRQGSKPKAGEMLSIHRQDNPGQSPDRRAPRVYHDLQTQSDGTGRFTFDRVPPGKATVAVQVKLSENTTGYSQSTPVEVKAGETAEVNVGGVGRPVVGRVNIPAELAGRVNWSEGHAGFSTKVEPTRRAKLPENWDEMDEAARQKWGEEWNRSPEAQAQRAAQEKRKHYTMRINGDGTFRTEDVLPGAYEVNLMLNGPRSTANPGRGEPIATGRHQFTVPEIPGGQMDDPLDVGVIELKAVREVKVGEVSPELAVKTLDGKPFKLGDQRGKYVLAYFWSAGWAPAMSKEVAPLKEAHARFANDERLVMLGLVVDEDPELARKFIGKHQLAWPQAYLGSYQTSDVPQQWGLRGLPAAFLIGPDGKVIARDLKGDGIAAALKSALGEPRGK